MLTLCLCRSPGRGFHALCKHAYFLNFLMPLKRWICLKTLCWSRIKVMLEHLPALQIMPIQILFEVRMPSSAWMPHPRRPLHTLLLWSSMLNHHDANGSSFICPWAQGFRAAPVYSQKILRSWTMQKLIHTHQKPWYIRQPSRLPVCESLQFYPSFTIDFDTVLWLTQLCHCCKQGRCCCEESLIKV